MTDFITSNCTELTSIVIIDTNSICWCKSNYHTVVTTIALMALVSYLTHVWEPSQLTKYMLKTINISWKWKFNAKLRNKYTDGNIVKVSDTLIDNILVQFNGGICQLSRGILMRRNCEHIFPICFWFFLFFMKNVNHVCLKDKNTKLRTFKYQVYKYRWCFITYPPTIYPIQLYIYDTI